MDRRRAVALVEELLHRLHDGRRVWPLRLVTEVYVFGSFARGALTPHDIDLDVEVGRDDRWTTHFVDAFAAGRDPYAVIRRALTGGRRSFQVLFEGAKRVDFPLTLLWRRGDRLDVALRRLHAIAEDPTAARAVRDAMLAQFEGLDRWVPRGKREQLVEAVGAGAIGLERFVLPEGEPTCPDTVWRLARRWPPTSPLMRAAKAVVAYAEQRGIDPGQIWLHGRDIRRGTTPYFAGFNLRYFKAIPWCLTEHGGVEWIDVVHPTSSGRLDALRITPLDRDFLAKADWS